MHKKLFTAVLALGLLLVASVPVFAAAIEDLRQDPPVATYGNGQPKVPESRILLEDGPTVQISAGTARTVPGTFCDGYWQGPQTYRIPNWLFGNELYAVYQDPDGGLPYSWGTCGVPTNYTFDVTTIYWRLTARPPAVGVGPYPYTLIMQPLTFDVDPGSPVGCPIPGGVHCAGGLVAVTFNNAGAGGITYEVGLNFPVECCVTEPYFAGTYTGGPNPNIGLTIQLLLDDGTFNGGPVLGQLCRTYNEFGFGWCDLNDPADCAWFELNMLLWSEGYTPDDAATHCNPGVCVCQNWYIGIDAAVFGAGGCESFGGSPGACRNDCWSRVFPLPTAEGGFVRTKSGVAFEAIGLDTLKSVGIRLSKSAGFCPLSAGVEDTAALIMEVWDDGGALEACGRPTPGALLYSVAVPKSMVVYDPLVTEVPVPDITWGTLNGGPLDIIFVTFTFDAVNSTQPNDCVIIAAGDPGAFGCGSATHSVEEVIGAAGGPWFWMDQRPGAGGIRELWIDADICQEVLPAVEADCGVPSGANDDWPNYAHDLGQTSASDIRVGDPNQVTVAWANPLANNVNFTNPTVTNDIVYITRDVAIDAYDLTTGALVGTHSGNPEMSVSGNRTNTTVAFTRGIVAGPDRDLAFTAGGTFPAISAWELTLENAGPAIWSRSGASPPSLAQQVRFGAMKVVDVGGTDVIFTVTEPIAGTGRLWAHVAGTGALYGGWLTNPVILDAAAKHGPAVNGGKLYVGTAIGGSNVSGSLYQIDAATGTVDWNFIGVVGEGWPSGVSTEGDYLYGATKDVANNGYRYKIDKSGALPAVEWTSGQGHGLYGTPTIGAQFVYYPLDNPSSGLLQVDKDIGTVARNFAATDDFCGVTVFQIPQIVTLSCDAYIFAGDRAGHWWCLNAVDGSYEWYRSFPGTVMGTSLATAADNSDYAVVAVQFGTPAGLLSAYKLNSGSRPRLIQCSYDTQILVALNSGPGQPYAEADVFQNIGDLPLTFSGYSIADPLPGATASIDERRAMNNLIDASREFDGYTTIANAASITKSQRLAGLSSEMIDGGERTTLDVLRDKRLASGSRNASSRSMAASASAVRTSAVTLNGSGFPYILASAGDADLDFLFDGTGLGRATDVNVIEFSNNDPDFSWDAVNNGSVSIAEYTITYVGGCPQSRDTLEFGIGNSEIVFNYGALGFRADVNNFVFASDPVITTNANYDQGLYLLGDSTAGVNGGAQVFCEVYNGAANGRIGGFVPNTTPIGQQCGFDVQSDVLLGAKRTGGCPGTPVDIHGNIITNSISDTDFAAPAGTRLAAIGMDIIQTEVGATDALYGDFKLIEWEVVNRDAVAKGPIYIGTWGDWDVASYATNTGNFSAAANGYYIWDNSAPNFAYGNFDPAHRSTYSGIQPIDVARRIVVMDGALRQNGAWPGADIELLWSEGINETPANMVDPPAISDKQGWLLNGAMNFAPNGTQKRYQALYGGVDATSGNSAVIDLNLQALAKRAARWGGFARGDVNDDGLVDLADVCWLQGGNFIYPAAYSGDVDADGDNDLADITRLLSFVSGNAASQPEGAWRF